MRTKLVIWGACGHARVLADIVRLGATYEITGFLDDLDPTRAQTEFCGATVLGGSEQLLVLREQGIEHLLVGVGDCRDRLRLAAIARVNGFRLVTAIHPRATVARDVHIGEGTVAMAGAIINPGVHVGENVVINTSASVDHDCRIEDGAHLGPGVRLSGNVTVGRAAFLGTGAVVINQIRIGAGAVIGAGSVVLHDIPDGVLAYGVPARVIKRFSNNAEDSD